MDLMKKVSDEFPGRFTTACAAENILEAAEFIKANRPKTAEEKSREAIQKEMAELKKLIFLAVGIVAFLVIFATCINYFGAETRETKTKNFLLKVQEMKSQATPKGTVKAPRQNLRPRSKARGREQQKPKIRTYGRENWN